MENQGNFIDEIVRNSLNGMKTNTSVKWENIESRLKFENIKANPGNKYVSANALQKFLSSRLAVYTGIATLGIALFSIFFNKLDNTTSNAIIIKNIQKNNFEHKTVVEKNIAISVNKKQKKTVNKNKIEEVSQVAVNKDITNNEITKKDTLKVIKHIVVVKKDTIVVKDTVYINR